MGVFYKVEYKTGANMGNILTLLGLVCIGAGTCLGMFEERKNSTNKTVKKEENC